MLNPYNILLKKKAKRNCTESGGKVGIRKSETYVKAHL